MPQVNTALSTGYIGIDPGASGALCHVNDDGRPIKFVDFATDGLLGYVNYLKTLDNTTPVILESVSAMPGQGVVSMFSFGQRFGELQGMLTTLGIGFKLTRPLKWQKFCEVEPKSGKKGVYAAMSKIYPNSPLTTPRGKILDGRCDALGIAYYNYSTRFEESI